MAQIKKAIAVILAMAILFSLSVALSACGNDSELKWSYELNEDGKSYTATPDSQKYFDEEAYRKYAEKHPDDEQALEKKYAELLEKAYKNWNKVTKASIPAEHKGLPVTKININYLKNAFSNLKTITVSENSDHFTVIDNVLYSKNIDAVYFVSKTLSGEFTIPDSVTSIGEWAFEDCTGLTSITIPNTVTYIGDHAFYSCTGLTSITIPDSVTSIGAVAFGGCTGLTSISGSANNVSNVVKYIRPSSFVVEITSGTSISQAAFSGCRGLTSITIHDSVTSIGNSAFRDCTGLTSITIPDSVTSIGSYAFENCTSLVSITIGNGVTSIDNGAFSGCRGLTSITIGYGLIEIDSSVFNQFTNLEKIIVSENNIVYASADGILYNKAKTEIIYIPRRIQGAVTIPEGVTSIGAGAFSGCTDLTSITIPISVISIGDYAFANCTGLTDIYYNGTRNQFKAIECGNYWNQNTGNYVIHYGG